MASCSDIPDERSEFIRYLTLSDGDRDKLVDKAVPKSTKNATKNWMNVLNSYLKEKRVANDMSEILDADLPRLLHSFYSEVTKAPTKKDMQKENRLPPERYSNTSMHALRAAINRYTEKDRKIDVISDQRFSEANQIFEAVLKVYKAVGKGAIKHKEPITEKDRQRLSDYFSRYMAPDPLILQRMVQYNLMFYLCRRGCENLTHMPKGTFDVSFLQLLICYKL